MSNNYHPLIRNGKGLQKLVSLISDKTGRKRESIVKQCVEEKAYEICKENSIEIPISIQKEIGQFQN